MNTFNCSMLWCFGIDQQAGGLLCREQRCVQVRLGSKRVAESQTRAVKEEEASSEAIARADGVTAASGLLSVILLKSSTCGAGQCEMETQEQVSHTHTYIYILYYILFYFVLYYIILDNIVLYYILYIIYITCNRRARKLRSFPPKSHGTALSGPRNWTSYLFNTRLVWLLG